MLGKYNRIDCVKYDDGTFTYLITGEYAERNNLEVDITADCDFNTEFTVVKRITVKTISNIHDVIDFAKGLDIDLQNKFNGTYLLVGSSDDFAIFDNLAYDRIKD